MRRLWLRRRQIGLAAVVALFGVLLSGVVWAQSVPYGGGGVNVWAPGVRVYVVPGGGVVVRAPFTSVHVRGYPYVIGGYGIEQPVPPSADLSIMDWKSLRRLLRSAATQLEADLYRLATGTTWKKHLRLGALRDLVAEDVEMPPERESLSQLLEILEAYDSTRANEQFRTISSLTAFRIVHTALGEFVSPPHERQRRLLAASAGNLDRSLARINTGATWQPYLALPAEVYAASDSTSGSGSTSAAHPEFEQLTAVLGRYDSVSQNAAYRVIAELPAFQETQERLSLYINLLTDPQSADSAPSQIEDLPLPKPEREPKSVPNR